MSKRISTGGTPNNTLFKYFAKSPATTPKSTSNTPSSKNNAVVSSPSQAGAAVKPAPMNKKSLDFGKHIITFIQLKSMHYQYHFDCR